MKIPAFSGKTLHESLFNPAQFRLQVKKQVNLSSKQDFAGSVPNLFVGRFGYPQVRLGLLATEQYNEHDDPLRWVQSNTSLQDIVTKRSELVNAGGPAHVKLPSGSAAQRVRELAVEAAMAIRPVDAEIGLDRKPAFRLSLEDDTLPHGPTAALSKAAITANPKIPTFVHKVVDDTDLRAGSGLGQLWRKGLGEHQLSKLLSAGTLGQKLQRRLVPTRWGITAVDDTVGRQLHKQVLDAAEGSFWAFFGGYMGNYFLILTLPQPWSFELFENYVGDRTNAMLSVDYTDFEGVRGRSQYAEHTAGGYYASRIAVLEHLAQRKRQVGVIALRFISDEYWAPLGVWVVRQAVRAAMSEKPLEFGSWDLLRRYALEFVRRKFGADLSGVLAASRLLAQRRSQTTLARFF